MTIDALVWTRRAGVLSRMGGLGIGLAYEHPTANGGHRLVFGGQDTLEVRITREAHAYIVTGYGTEPYSADVVARAVTR